MSAEMDIVMDEEAGGERGVENEYIEPVALLMDELKSEDTTVRVESMRRLRTIALALGPERTRTELIPFLQSSLDDEDEVLATLAEEFVNLVSSVGGTGHVQTLLPLLEGLVSAEETFVRHKALEACSNVLEAMPFDDVVEHFLPLLQRLATGDWFSKKTSVAALAVAVIERLRTDVPDAKVQGIFNDLIVLFNTLAMDESPLVRKAVATNLVKMAALAGDAELPKVTDVCMQLASDPQDSVRLLAVEPLAVLLGASSTEAQEPLIPVFLSLASDNSWRIRFMVASQYGRFVETLASRRADGKADLLAIYCALLQDAESEVRAAASGQLSAVASCLVEEVGRDQILEAVRLLLADPSAHVRAALALQLSDLAKSYGLEMYREAG